MDPINIKAQAPAINIQKLCEEVSNNRIKTLTIAFCKMFDIDTDFTKQVVVREVEILRTPYYNGFSKWSEDELQKYLTWQNSSIPQKIKQALLDEDTVNGYAYLSDEEVATVEKFAASDLGKKKDALDAELEPLREKVADTIRSEIEKIVNYYAY